MKPRRMRKRLYRQLFRILPVAFSFLVAISIPARGGEVKLGYAYNLATFTGTVPYSWPRLTIDSQRKEVYVVNTADQTVSVYNETGMQVFTFGDDGAFGYIRSLVLDENGKIYILSGAGSQYAISRANYRGEPEGTLQVRNLPPLYLSNFTPERIFWREGRFYLVDPLNLKVVVTDSSGSYEKGYDLAALVGIDEKKKNDTSIVGFSIDREGNFLFSIPVLFSVYIVTPEGKVTSFGTRGSSPGKFNVIAGVAADERGYIYVADTLKCAIMIFDREHDFQFKGQFGYRGYDPGDLIGPSDIVLSNDLLYVGQNAARGVSVFRITAQ